MSSAPDPNRSIGFLVSDTARLMRRNFNRRAQELGLSLAQWRVLAALVRRQGVNQVTLAESQEIQPMTVARLIDRLEEAGLVARRPDPQDRRAFRLYLTEAAQPLVARMWQLAAKTRADAMSGLSAEAAAILTESLERMCDNLLAAEAGPAGGE